MRYPFGRERQRLIPYLLILPALLLYLIIAFGPSLATFGYSFTDATGTPNTPVNWVGWDNYEEFLFIGQAAKENLEVVYRTVIFSVLVTTIQFGLGLLLALLLNLNLFGTRFFRTIFFMPVILGVVIQGLIWRLVLNPFGGPVAQIFNFFGIQNELLGGLGAFWWVIVVQIWANAGITMIIFLAGLQTVPEELYEAARIDGANNWQLFSKITWPMITPSVNTNLILNVIGSLQAWQLFWVLIGYRAGTTVLGYEIYAQGFGQTGSVSAAFRQGYAAAASIILFVMVLFVGLGTQTILNRREEKLLG